MTWARRVSQNQARSVTSAAHGCGPNAAQMRSSLSFLDFAREETTNMLQIRKAVPADEAGLRQVLEPVIRAGEGYSDALVMYQPFWHSPS